MPKFLVTVSFASVIVGSHAAGEEIDLTAEEAKDLAPFILPVPKSQTIETAAIENNAETADLKSPRRKKG